MFVITKLLDFEVDTVRAFANEQDARKTLLQMVIDNIIEYGEEISDEQDAFNYIEETGGNWQLNYIDFCNEGPLYQLFEVPIE